MSDETEEVETSQRSRSPRHPNYDLAKTVDKAALLYKQERMNAAPRKQAMIAMGFTDKSSPGRQMLATLAQYGLLDKAPDGQVRLSRLAQRIFILTAPEQKAERMAALREAARAPEMHRDVLARFPHGLPSDPVLRYYLIHDKQFVDDSADDFIRDLKATFAFAEVAIGEDNLPPEATQTQTQPPSAEENPMSATAMPPPPSPLAAPRPEAIAQPALGRATVQLALGRGKWATLNAPESMTEREWANLLAALGAAKVGFILEIQE